LQIFLSRNDFIFKGPPRLIDSIEGGSDSQNEETLGLYIRTEDGIILSGLDYKHIRKTDFFVEVGMSKENG
jgi:hypothetical protein